MRSLNHFMYYYGTLKGDICNFNKNRLQELNT